MLSMTQSLLIISHSELKKNSTSKMLNHKSFFLLNNIMMISFILLFVQFDNYYTCKYNWNSKFLRILSKKKVLKFSVR